MDKKDEFYANRIKQKCMSGDTEADHINADNIICELLKELGLIKTADAYSEVEKWFA